MTLSLAIIVGKRLLDISTTLRKGANVKQSRKMLSVILDVAKRRSRNALRPTNATLKLVCGHTRIYFVVIESGEGREVEKIIVK